MASAAVMAADAMATRDNSSMSSTCSSSGILKHSSLSNYGDHRIGQHGVTAWGGTTPPQKARSARRVRFSEENSQDVPMDTGSTSSSTTTEASATTDCAIGNLQRPDVGRTARRASFNIEEAKAYLKSRNDSVFAANGTAPPSIGAPTVPTVHLSKEVPFVSCASCDMFRTRLEVQIHSRPTSANGVSDNSAFPKQNSDEKTIKGEAMQQLRGEPLRLPSTHFPPSPDLRTGDPVTEVSVTSKLLTIDCGKSGSSQKPSKFSSTSLPVDDTPSQVFACSPTSEYSSASCSLQNGDSTESISSKQNLSSESGSLTSSEELPSPVSLTEKAPQHSCRVRCLTPPPKKSEGGSPTDTCRVNLDTLPESVLLCVLSNLSTVERCRCALVNTRLSKLVWAPSLWRSINFSAPSPSTPADPIHDDNKALASKSSIDVVAGLRCILKRLGRRADVVQQVTVRGCPAFTDELVYEVVTACVHLSALDLSYCSRVTDLGILAIMLSALNIQYLNLSGCSVTLRMPSQALERCYVATLKHLNISDCKGLDDESLSNIANVFPYIQSLYLRHCPMISDSGMHHLALGCSNLKELSVCHCSGITDFALCEISKLGQNLRYLSVSGCTAISDNGIAYLARLSPRLRYLNVRGCERVTDDTVLALVKNCSRLRSLDLGKCALTDKSLFAISEGLQGLRKLGVKGCTGLTDAGIAHLCSHCTSLALLNIQDCKIHYETYRLIAKRCRSCIIEHNSFGCF